jgi:hypothetical protein
MMRAVLAISCAALIAAPASAQVIEALDTCLATEAKTQEVFTERYPHERCTPLSSCAPQLLETSKILADRRCRADAIDTCVTAEDPTACATLLSTRWQDGARDLMAQLQTRWDKTDPATLSPFARKRFTAPDAFALEKECPDAQGHKPPWSEAQHCALTLAFRNLETTQAKTRYLIDARRSK